MKKKITEALNTNAIPVDASGLSSEESIDAFLAMGDKLYPDDPAIRASVKDIATQMQHAVDAGDGINAEVKLVMGPGIKDQMDHCNKIRNLLQHSGIHIKNWRPVFGGARMWLSLGASAPMDKIAKDLAKLAQDIGGNVPGLDEIVKQFKENRVNPKSRCVGAQFSKAKYEQNKDIIEQFKRHASEYGYRVFVEPITNGYGGVMYMGVDFSAQSPYTKENPAAPNLNETVADNGQNTILNEALSTISTPVSERIASFTEQANKFAANNPAAVEVVNSIIERLNQMASQHQPSGRLSFIYLQPQVLGEIVNILKECGIRAEIGKAPKCRYLDISFTDSDLSFNKNRLIINELKAAERDAGVDFPWVNAIIGNLHYGHAKWEEGDTSLFGFSDEEVSTPEFKRFVSACRKHGLTVSVGPCSRGKYVTISWAF